MSKGHIYLMLNPTMPNYLKIGMTTRTPEDRARELSQASGVAVPYAVAYSEEVIDCEAAERKIHTRLSKFRVNRGREFFHLPLCDAIRELTAIADEIGRHSTGIIPVLTSDKDDDLHDNLNSELPTHIEIENDTKSTNLESNKIFTIDDHANYIIDFDVRSLFLIVIDSIRELGDDVQEQVDSKGITYWLTGHEPIKPIKFGELVPKKKSFYSGFKVSPEANTLKSKWPVVKSKEWKWSFSEDITTKEKADELVTESMVAYQLMKKIRFKSV